MAGGNGGFSHSSNGGKGGGIGSDGSGQPGYDAGRSGRGGSGGGGSGTSGQDGDGGGGGGGGNAGLTGSFTAKAPIVGQAGGNGADGQGGGVDAAEGGGGGGGGGGAGGYGYFYATGTPSPQTISEAVTGGTGGNGGSGGSTYVPINYGARSSGGDGGDGGAGIFFADTGSVIIEATVTGGGGGGGGGGPQSGQQGLGGAGVSGSGIGVTLDAGGSITGGNGRSGQADAIDFTGGTNSLTLNNAAANSGLTGNLGLGGTVTITTDAAGGTTLTSVLHDYVDPTTGAATAGTLTKAGTGTLTLSANNTYTGGTTIAAGTLQLGDGKTTGLIVGKVVNGGTLAFDEVAATPLTFSGIISDDGAAAGAVTQLGGTTVLSATNTYTGGTTLNAGTLDLAGPTVLNGGVIASAAAGTGAITFGAGANATLRVENNALSSTGAATARFANTVAAFAAGDTMDVRGIGPTVASFNYGSDVLTLTGATTTTLQLSGNYAGEVFTATPDGSTGSNVTLTNVSQPAPTIGLASDTGVSSNDHVTMNPTVTGNDDVGAMVTIKDAAGNTLTSFTATNATYSFTPTTLANGSNTLTVSETRAGETGSASTSFTLDTTPPTITALADSGPGIDRSGNGDLGAGKVVTLTVTNSEPVYVSGGTPTLSLNDGGTATYTGGSGTNTLTFSTLVAAGQNTAALAVTAVNANGATVTDAAGNPVNPSLAGASVPSGTLIVDTTPPVASSPTLTVAQNASATPIGIAAPSDNLTAADSLLIAISGLPSDGTVAFANGTAVTAGQSLTAAQLTGLTFTPTPYAALQSSTFTYAVTDGAGNAATGTATLSVGAAPAPTPVQPTPTAPAVPVPSAAPDAVSIDPHVTFLGHGTFSLTGTVSSAAGVKGVELSADVNGGGRVDLGPATLNADGTFSFKDLVGANLQGFIYATETDGAGLLTTTGAPFSLQAGIRGTGHVAEQDSYDASGTALTSSSLFHSGGSRTVDVDTGGQTFHSGFFDTFLNGGAPGNTFVFDPGHGLDVVGLFRVNGSDHDTLSFKGSDFGSTSATQLAALLANTSNRPGGAVITDPTSGDTVRLAGITKAQLVHNQGDFAFHA